MFNVLGRGMAIEVKGHNFLFHGIENSISITVEGVNCNDIFLEIDSGYIKTSVNTCEKYIVPYGRNCEISIYFIEKADTVLVKRKSFVVKAIPTPYVNILGHTGGEIDKGVVKVLDKLRLGVRHDLEFPPYEIVSFNLIILTGNKISHYFINNKEGRITKEMKDALSFVKQGDILCFSSVVVLYPDNNIEVVSPVSLIIK
jgi:hypothetical protein